MAYRLRMPAEIGDWLAGFAGSEPEAAAETGAALLALMAADAIPGPPLVTDPAEPGREPADPRELLDYQYQRLLDDTSRLRRELADAAAERDRTARLLAAADPGSPLRDHLERRLQAAQRLTDALGERGRFVQRHLDAFRAQKETAKAHVTAEETRVRIQEALQAAGLSEDGDDMPADPYLGASEATARLEQVRAAAFRLLGIDPAAGQAASRRGADIRELRADPLGSDTRILFAEEPAATVTLLAVLEDEAAVAEHREAALELATGLLAEIRDDGWPADSLDFAEGDDFVARFFAGRGPDLSRRAAALGSATSLARLRGAGLSATALARRAGLRPDIIMSIDRRPIRHADVARVAAYARALGGTLRLTIDLDGEEHVIR